MKDMGYTQVARIRVPSVVVEYPGKVITVLSDGKVYEWDQWIEEATVWSNSKIEDSMCIMLTDVTRAEIRKLVTGKRSKLQQIINENVFTDPRRAGVDLLGPLPK